MRYGSNWSIPDSFTDKQKREIEETIKEFEHQFAMVEKFGEDTLLVWKKINEERGYNMGKYLMGKYEITGSDMEAVKQLIEAYLHEDPERTAQPEISLEGDVLTITSSGFCPIIETANIMDINMAHTCPFSTRPYFLAMCRALNPGIKHKNAKWRTKGDTTCQEIFWIEG
jgi:hypothetical protein